MEKLTATQVCYKLNLSVAMLNIWYYWYFNDEFVKPADTPPLPRFTQATPRGTRYWEAEDVRALKRFKSWLPRGRGGVMGAATAKYRAAKKPTKA